MAGGTASAESFTRAELEGRSLADLHELAAAREISSFRLLRRDALIELLAADPQVDDLQEQREEEPEAPRKPGRRSRLHEREQTAELPSREEPEPSPEPEAQSAQVEEGEVRSGVLEVVPDGYGFMRVEGFRRSNADVYVPAAMVRELGLRRGDQVAGPVRPPRRSERYLSMVRIETVNGRSAADHDPERSRFDGLTPVGGSERLPLRLGREDLALRMIELVSAFEKGQRYLISGPPGSGATTLLKTIAGAVEDGGLTPLLIAVDASPEEVTDWERSAALEVHASSAEQPAGGHVELAELSLERAKRLVEEGRDVVILLDSLTRLARAYGLARSGSRHSEEGDAPRDGVSAVRRWFAAGRNTEEQGSLTIVATVCTGSDSRLEELVHDGVADLAGAEVRLNGDLAGDQLWPAIDVSGSRARPRVRVDQTESAEAARVQALRRRLALLEPGEAWRLVAGKIRETPSNAELVSRLDAEA